MEVKRTFCLATLLIAALAFVGCEAEEEPYVSPSGQEVAPDVVINTPADAVTVNLLIEDGVFDIELTSAFNWSTTGYYNYASDYFYYTYEDVRYRFNYNEQICDLGAMNGLGNITTFSTPNPAYECAVIKGHGYIFYREIAPNRVVSKDNDTIEESVQQAVFNDYLNNNGLEYYCVWVKDVFENGITVQYVVRNTSVVTNF